MRKLLLIVCAILAASCASQKDITYFQDIQPGETFSYIDGQDLTVQSDDVVSIVVSSKNPELAMLFNLPKVQQVAGSGTGTLYSRSDVELSGYSIDANGEIDFPILGKIHIAGLTKDEISIKIKNILVSENLIKDPIVTVNFLNLTFSALGEVARPGKYNLEKNQTTILEALSMAGDLTIFGLRDQVLVTREQGGHKVTYQLDLRSKDIYNSPAYFVQQNDVIYVVPNKVKANQSTVNGNTLQSTSFWMSVASLLTTITVLFVK